MSCPEILATATLEKRKTDLGTSPRVLRLIPRRAGSISTLYGAKTNLKAKKKLCKLKKNVPPNKRPKHCWCPIISNIQDTAILKQRFDATTDMLITECSSQRNDTLIICEVYDT